MAYLPTKLESSGNLNVPNLMHFVTILTNENEVIFDPFSGSGSSGVAALMHHRKFIGSEIDKEYYKNSKERLDSVIKNE